jgi:hypothetical protein
MYREGRMGSQDFELQTLKGSLNYGKTIERLNIVERNGVLGWEDIDTVR